MDVSILSNMATLSLFIGTLPSIVAIIKNRKCIESFSTLGAVGILAGQVLLVTYFVLIGDWVTVLLMTPVTAFWTLVLFFKATVKVEKEPKQAHLLEEKLITRFREERTEPERS